jgi:hypothetical protein
VDHTQIKLPCNSGTTSGRREDTARPYREGPVQTRGLDHGSASSCKSVTQACFTRMLCLALCDLFCYNQRPHVLHVGVRTLHADGTYTVTASQRTVLAISQMKSLLKVLEDSSSDDGDNFFECLSRNHLYPLY